MAVTTAALIQRVKMKLNEDNNTPAGSLPSGTSGTDTITSDNGITQALNDSKNRLCRTVFFVHGAFTFTFAANAYSVTLDSATPVTGGTHPTPTGSKLWWVRGAQNATPTPLIYCGLSYLSAAYPAYRTTAGTPQYFWFAGQEFGIYPMIAAGGSITAQGPTIPPDTANDGTSDFTFIQPAQSDLLVLDTSALILEKNMHDAQLSARFGPVTIERNRMANELWGELPATLRAPGAAFGRMPYPESTAIPRK